MTADALTDEDRIAYWQGAYERMAARNHELAAKAEWQPIETAPMDGTDILLHQAGWGRVVLGWRGSDGWYFYDEPHWSEALQEDIANINGWTDDKQGPTHWMPLPDVPSPSQTQPE